jgi:S1-C subfamily serine protease
MLNQIQRLQIQRLRVLVIVCCALAWSSHVSAQEIGRVGATVTDLTLALASMLGVPHAGGAYVTAVVTDGPADSVGIMPMDILVSFQGEPIASVQDLVCSLARTRPGDVVRFTLFRDQQLRTVLATLDRWPLGVPPAAYRMCSSLVS